jgi:hypothetical protein
MNYQERRQELADFLQSRRARLTPAQMGLETIGRRRIPGLRREEVSQLAGVSLTWYTWLEQGREIQVSWQVLDSLARTLQLSSAERAHLFMLARHPSADDCNHALETVSPALQRALDYHEPSPAYITGRRWDILAWNRAACAVFGDFGATPPGERNILWYLFTYPRVKKLLVDWEGETKRIVAEFRASAGVSAGDPWFRELVENLCEVSPVFRDLWSQHDVLDRLSGRKEINHSRVGRLVLEHTTYQVNDNSNLKLVLYTPLPETDTLLKLQKLALK